MDELHYQNGFANEHESEASPGTLPVGRNSPQRPAHGLYTEQLSGTSFTAGRSEFRRSWLYRIRPSAAHADFVPVDNARYFEAGSASFVPSRFRWMPLPLPTGSTNFIEGLHTMAIAGSPESREGAAYHVYAAASSMDFAFSNHDAEMLVFPQSGTLRAITEFGVLEIGPQELLLIPRGVKFRIELPDGASRGYVCENFGAHLRLPELGPIGSNGLANARDFQAPTAWFEDVRQTTRLLVKFAGSLWQCDLDHSPFDVVAWHGNLCPYKYDMMRFMSINSVSYDHADPSIGALLTSPSAFTGTPNFEIAIFPPRWLVAEDTFRPPWFHRNVMCEFVGVLSGLHEAHGSGFPPGACSLHNSFAAHGPDPAVFERASSVALSPEKLSGSILAVFETRLPCRVSAFARSTPLRKPAYDATWDTLPLVTPPKFA
ncbi:homogentisate 1,2-dioxygenase [Paraburkholderia xenovorans LB400]|uniref:Homogentisate 1,2-dioxygenase n=1 Tax=Paraburkholderia xenovorans (strain LB400) TaxID=266265 RepID=Q13G93_PARXL|nr:homogentisate 1,2-dioxygenase [Paraburkholderia xenovorans]ABE36896.1 homogentisate 1,2-dioxygenase [Paraburkholderia xenovorans LB400]AIP34024.1 homogentisate 1,2-dioxygenase [Paraburkholderia xenovorans LB400]